MNTEPQYISEIKVQKAIRDEAYNTYASKTRLENRLLYLKTELCLAKLELNYNQLKESRNTCWRVISECRERGGYGKFYDETLIPCWIDAYLILGDMFYLRGDRIQARECYEKADNVLMGQLKPDNNNIDIIYKAGICKTKLGCILFKRPYYQNGDRYLKDALSYFNQLRCTDSKISKPKYIISCPIHLDKICKDKFSCQLLKNPCRENVPEISEHLRDALQNELIQNEEEYKDISKYISLCNIYLAKSSKKLSESEKLTVYRESYSVLKSLLGEKPISENILNVYDIFLEVGELKKQTGDISAATQYYNKGMDIIRHYDGCLLEHIVLQCQCLHDRNMSQLQVLSGDIDSQELFASYAVSSAELLHEKYPSPDSQDLLGETYLTLANSQNKYAEKALDLYHELSKQHQSRFSFSGNYRDYYYEFASCRDKLWNSGLINSNYFSTTRLYPCPGEFHRVGLSCIDVTFRDDRTGRDYRLNINFVGTKLISEEIEYIEICEVTLENWIDLTLIQLCEGKEMIGTQLNPTPDEFITIVYADEKSTKVRYQRCYG